MRAYKSRHVLPLADLATILAGVNLYAAKFMFRLMCLVSVPKKATFSCSGECRANIPPSYHGRILEQEKINWYILGVSESLSPKYQQTRLVELQTSDYNYLELELGLD